MRIIYAGIGSHKNTPDDVLYAMRVIAKQLSRSDWVLRSGGADECDSAWEEGANPDTSEIYLPWAGYNGNRSPHHSVCSEALRMAERFHPNWNLCNRVVRLMHGRNAHIIFGKNLDTPVNCVLCYTKNAEIVGGTGQSIRMAQTYRIPVFNLADPAVFNGDVRQFVLGLKSEMAD